MKVKINLFQQHNIEYRPTSSK